MMRTDNGHRRPPPRTGAAAAIVAGALAAAVGSGGLTGTGGIVLEARAAPVAPRAAWHCAFAELACTLLAQATPTPPAPAGPSPAGWRLVRTPNPRGGAEGIAIMHVADITRSDPDFAGLMLRCADKQVESLVVLITPLRPQSRPNVHIVAGANDMTIKASVVTPFSSVRLPEEATAMITGPWRARPELKITVADEDAKIEGAILLAGLPEALQSLKAECATREPVGTGR